MKNKIINSVLSQTLFIIISGIIALVTVPLLINMLGKIEYGAFELISSLMIITFLLEFGMGSTLVKYIPEHKENIYDLKKFIWSYFYIKLSVTIMGCLTIILIGYHFDTLFKLETIPNIEALKIAVYVFSLGILFSSISTFLDNILKGFVYFGSVNMAKIFSILQFFILFYAYYYFFETYNIIIIALMWFSLRPLISILNTLIVFKRVKLLHLLVPTRFKYTYIKNTLHFLFGMSYITLVAQLYNLLPKIILGSLLGPIYVGYWGIIDRIRKPLQDIQSATLRPLIPLLSDKKNSNLTTETIFQASRLYYVLVSFLGLIILMNINLLIEKWIGKDFLYVAELLKILLLPFIFPNVGVLLMMYYAKGETKINSIFLTINTFMSIGLSTILLILYKDMRYFVYAYSLTFIVLTSILLFFYLKYFKIDLFKYIREVLLPIFIVILMTLFLASQLTLLLPSTILGLLLGILFTALIYIILFYLISPDQDKDMIISLFRKLKKKR